MNAQTKANMLLIAEAGYTSYHTRPRVQKAHRAADHALTLTQNATSAEEHSRSI
jgi:hypothetical protein